jgi:hypothetical protein
MVRAYFLFKGKTKLDPKYLASFVSMMVITLLTLSLFSVLQVMFKFPNVLILAVFPIAIFLERIGEKHFEISFDKVVCKYNHLEEKRFENMVVVLTYLICSLIIAILLGGLAAHV